MTTTEPQPPRRSQAERSAATRARIIDAAVATVVTNGFAATNLQEIAGRAGVTVGAIQHQFGDKASVLITVIDQGLDRLVTDLASHPVAASGLDERVAEFIAQVWEGYSGPFYQAAIEILLGMRTDPHFASRVGDTMVGVLERIDDLWMGTLSDVPASVETHRAAQRLTFDTLNGLALERILTTGTPFETVVLDSLSTAVVQLLSTVDE